jgi:hypothetical protein
MSYALPNDRGSSLQKNAHHSRMNVIGMVRQVVFGHAKGKNRVVKDVWDPMIGKGAKTLWNVCLQCPILRPPTLVLPGSASVNGSDYGTGNMNVTASGDDPRIALRSPRFRH